MNKEIKVTDVSEIDPERWKEYEDNSKMIERLRKKENLTSEELRLKQECIEKVPFLAINFKKRLEFGIKVVLCPNCGTKIALCDMEIDTGYLNCPWCKINVFIGKRIVDFQAILYCNCLET